MKIHIISSIRENLKLKKEIIIAVVTAILTSTITYFATNVDQKITEYQLQEIANNIINKDALKTVLLNEFSKDSRFFGKDGKDLNFHKYSVVAFNSKKCPKGWEEYQKAYGRFIRGIDRLGSLDPGREIGSEQDDSFKSHVHSTEAGEVTLGGNGTRTGRPQQSGNLETGSKGGSETRPKNVALLYCEKK